MRSMSAVAPPPTSELDHTPAPLAMPALSRLLADLLPESRGTEGEAPLDLPADKTQPPRLISAAIIEGHQLRARRIVDPPVIGFAAFLDGTQETQVSRYVAGGIPIVVGTVGAVIRDRRNQRMFTWRRFVARRVYAPRAHLSPDAWRRLATLTPPPVDTTDGDADEPLAHPLALREAAVHRVQEERQLAEQRLARKWCELETRPLLVDGGISGADTVARAACAVGVVKSHRTLYAQGDALTTVLSLERAHRSSVFRVTSPKRTNVASWYLRMRDPRGHEPMWGLVRVEVAEPQPGEDVSARADLVSRWILAEAAPLSLPDARWDKMVYGVRDCEVFLRATR
ncbi:MAG TPA: hypothetical protein VN651_12560 [Gemmatimonadaceae bacterium]|nr:hypothetical protein [Gemmatimonadaceae bacterium]